MALTVYTFVLLLEEELQDVLYHINICFIFCTENIHVHKMYIRRLFGPV